jgi:hypothetical protein
MLDTSSPNTARIYDYILGGRENFKADRDAADSLMRLLPDAKQMVRDYRDFLRRVVCYLSEQGIGQFLDIGSGLPTQENVHQVAHRANPRAKVGYVDHDPMVISHGNSLLAKSKEVIVVQADLRQPGDLLSRPEIRDHFDFGQPIAVLLLQVLHFVSDDDDPAGIVAALREEICSGSYIAIAHVTADHVPGDVSDRVAAMYRRANDVWPRSKDEIRQLFDGFDLVEPGLTPEHAWRPGAGGVPERSMPTGWAGVARKPLLPALGPGLAVHGAVFSLKMVNKG